MNTENYWTRYGSKRLVGILTLKMLWGIGVGLLVRIKYQRTTGSTLSSIALE